MKNFREASPPPYLHGIIPPPLIVQNVCSLVLRSSNFILSCYFYISTFLGADTVIYSQKDFSSIRPIIRYPSVPNYVILNTVHCERVFWLYKLKKCHLTLSVHYILTSSDEQCLKSEILWKTINGSRQSNHIWCKIADKKLIYIG